MLRLSRLYRSQFFRFSLVGGIGFFVDALVLYALIYLADAGLLLGRVFSYMAAATTTWYLNKLFTFGDAAYMHPVKQWARFLVTNGVGGLVNYGVYTLIVLAYADHLLAPLVGVMAGSIAGLVFNYTLSRHFVFNQVRS